MTLDRLERLVLRFANSVPTRYWTHFNYPRQDPWQMAIKVYSPDPDLPVVSISPVLLNEMSGLGGTWHAGLWTFDRTNEDGTPFRSDL